MSEAGGEQHLRSKTFRALQTLKQHRGHAGGGERRAAAVCGHARRGWRRAAAASCRCHRGSAPCCQVGCPSGQPTCPAHLPAFCSALIAHTVGRPCLQTPRLSKCPTVRPSAAAAAAEGVLLQQEAQHKKGLFGGKQSHWWTLFMCVWDTLFIACTLAGCGGCSKHEGLQVPAPECPPHVSDAGAPLALLPAAGGCGGGRSPSGRGVSTSLMWRSLWSCVCTSGTSQPTASPVSRGSQHAHTCACCCAPASSARANLCGPLNPALPCDCPMRRQRRLHHKADVAAVKGGWAGSIAAAAAASAAA